MKTSSIVSLLFAFVLAISCQKQPSNISGDVENLYVVVYLLDEEGNNLLSGELADNPIEAYFRGSRHVARRDVDEEEIRSLLWRDKAFHDMTWWGLVLIKDASQEPFLFFGIIASWEKVDDEMVINWGDGTKDSIHLFNESTPSLRRSIIYNNTNYPTGKVKIVHKNN